MIFLEKHRNKIEEHGTVMEKMGMTPVASRIYVYLLLSPEDGLFDLNHVHACGSDDQ